MFVVFYCWAAMISAVVGDNSESDYYGNKALRLGNEAMDCNSEVFKNICTLKCGENHACLFGKCFCVKSDTGHIKDEYIFKKREAKATEQHKELKAKMEYAIRPTLRHHIAHFCANLDEARNCIRKCNQLGKPAFCGKDHVCYCGHNYGYPSNKKEDPEKNYNQFQDLYEKYFGSKGGSN